MIFKTELSTRDAELIVDALAKKAQYHVGLNQTYVADDCSKLALRLIDEFQDAGRKLADDHTS